MVPKRRIPTKPTRAAKQKRLDNKTKRSRVKHLRSGKPDLGLSGNRASHRILKGG